MTVQGSNDLTDFVDILDSSSITSTGVNGLDVKTYARYVRLKIEPSSGSFTADCTLNRR